MFSKISSKRELIDYLYDSSPGVLKAIMGGSGVVGDGRLWRDGTREARRPAWRKRRKDSRYRPPRGAERASESRLHAGVRAPIVAMKPGNAGGAKGCRKVET